MQSHLQVGASLEQVRLDLGEPVPAEVELAQEGQVLELARAEDGVEVVAEQVVAEPDRLQRVLHAVEHALRQPADAVPREVDHGEREVGGREELRAQRLQAGVALRELLDVQPVGQEREELGESGAVAVDARRVDGVEAAHAGEVQVRVEVHAGDLVGAEGQAGERQDDDGQGGRHLERSVATTLTTTCTKPEKWDEKMR